MGGGEWGYLGGVVGGRGGRVGTDRRTNGGRRGGEMKGRGCLLVTMMVMEHGSSHF